MFRLEMLPAREGDCLIVSWGSAQSPKRLLIDAGRDTTANEVLEYAQRNGNDEGMFELFIVTHIDRDHIEGAVPLLRDGKFRRLIKEVWFNTRGDLQYASPAPGFEEFGALDGERLDRLLVEHSVPTNLPFAPAPVVVRPDSLPEVNLPGGLRLTLVSPDQGQLEDLAKPWDDTVEAAPDGWEDFGEDQPLDIDVLARKPFKPDTAKPNGSSIAVVASYRGQSILLCADAHVQRLKDSLKIFASQHTDHRGFALVKASHHGSRKNVSRELVEIANSPRWAISTSGAHFKHPDHESIARIIAASPQPVELYFNYDTAFNQVWRGRTVGAYEFSPTYGVEGYLAIDIPEDE